MDKVKEMQKFKNIIISKNPYKMSFMSGLKAPKTFVGEFCERTYDSIGKVLTIQRNIPHSNFLPKCDTKIISHPQ